MGTDTLDSFASESDAATTRRRRGHMASRRALASTEKDMRKDASFDSNRGGKTCIITTSDQPSALSPGRRVKYTRFSFGHLDSTFAKHVSKKEKIITIITRNPYFGKPI